MNLNASKLLSHDFPMETLHFSTFIRAPRQTVWATMLEDATYRQWTTVFMPGSYYKGVWEQGSVIYFLAPDKDGKTEGGMVSRVAEVRPFEFVSLEHQGMIMDGVEDYTGPTVQPWIGAHENYTFLEKDGGTELRIDVDVDDTARTYMEQAWQKALEILKELAEKAN